MKKRNLNTRIVTIGALILSAGLIQACGSGGGSGAVAPTGGVVSGLNGQINSGLYQTCSNISEAQYIGAQYGVQISGLPSLVNSPDGTSNVCEVQMVAQSGYASSGQGRAFLGPNATIQDPLTVAMSLAPNDKVSLQAVGSSSSAFFATCSTSQSANFGATVYADVAGLGVFALPSGAQTVPSNGGGPVSVGLNQAYSSGDDPGCFVVSVIANVTRCVDSSGNSHPCP